MDMADEIVLLDISRSGDNSSATWERAQEFTKELFLPMTMGGGITSIDMGMWLMRECGADKLSINTHAFRHPEFITELASKVGSQSVVVSIDSKDDEVYINQGQEPTGTNVVAWAEAAQAMGAGELYLMDIDRDGSLQGYNLDLLKMVTSRVSIPVVISGGCGSYLHMDEGFNAGADACSTSCIFHFSKTGMNAMKEKLTERGHRIRVTG
jgi:cyclase